MTVDALTEPKPLSSAIAVDGAPGGNTGEVGRKPFGPREESRDEVMVFGAQRASGAKALVLQLDQLPAGRLSMSHCR